MKHDKIQRAIIELLKTEPFYAHFLMDCKIVRDFKHPMGYAAVAVVRGIPTLYIDSDWYCKLSDEEAFGVLKHEVSHLLFEHIKEDNRKGKNPEISNIAEDCTINQYIERLPEGCVNLKTVSDLVGEMLEPYRESDYYYQKLMTKVEEAKSAFSGFDVHDLDVDGKDTGELAKTIVNKIAKNAINKAAGKVHSSILELIEQLGESKLPWRTLLRNSIMSQISKKTITTTKRINRRFPLPVPGKKKKRELVLGVCIDESGSVSDEQHVEFMNEVQQIAKQVSKTYLIHADCEVSLVEDLSKVKFKASRRASGGTAYQPAIDKCRELKCNMIVYFGDFDTADEPKDPGVPFIWVGVDNNPAPANFGKVIRL